MVAIGAVIAVPFYPDGASAFEQAGISSAAVIAATFGLIVVIFLANWVALSARNQRDDASEEVLRQNGQLAEIERGRQTRQDLIDARRKLGSIMSNAGDLLVGYEGSPQFLSETMKIFEQAIALFRSNSPVFDDSHEGRYYAVITQAGENARRETPIEEEVQRVSLIAQIGFFERLIEEINAERLTLPR